MNDNKENIQTNRTSISKKHPSDQSAYQAVKSSIRVGYTVIKNNNENSIRNSLRNKKINHNQVTSNEIVAQKCKKKKQENYQSNSNKQDHPIKKILNKQLSSGAFIDSEYIKSQKEQPTFHKKGVLQARMRHYNGEGVKQNIENQSQFYSKATSRRCQSVSSINSKSQNPLPSYKHTGIKDIMEYQHAGNYRENKITDKCTKASALSRFCDFNTSHEYDFRKRHQFLR